MTETILPADHIEIACRVVARSEKAICIADGSTILHQGEAKERWFWLPLSQVSVDEKDDGMAIAIVPEWLAHKKGLI